MIYFDNSATTVRKPGAVYEAAAEGLRRFGNPGRSFHDASMDALRAVQGAREAVARLLGCADAQAVAFTSSATEALNLVVYGLLGPGDHAITTVAEHNSVLRPLYNAGCALSFAGCDEKGRLDFSGLERMLRAETKCLVCTHGSNVTGNVTDTRHLRAFCGAHGLALVLDAAQTLGYVEAAADDADFLCFTGHKGLLGPPGTGGVVARDLRGARGGLRIVKTGGAGAHSAERLQPLAMPDAFEAGTLNAPALHGLAAGVSYVLERGVCGAGGAVVGANAGGAGGTGAGAGGGAGGSAGTGGGADAGTGAAAGALAERFVRGVRGIPGVTLYGDLDAACRLPVVSLNIGDLGSDEAAGALWHTHGIATRPGLHCAPLLHERLGTARRGMVRFSFSCFNTEEEADAGIAAVKEVAKG
ncbi:MAG: aminotransferase class V-fold PLP-dependent enzyme [Clostridiales Family XIII bacterium]|jgi:selenocysteine lyase/cysteine desulfurase|nr:aminotransferase class V-fold PLP-dependent enzyme [Clostridiales Family XIII bacterium]